MPPCVGSGCRQMSVATGGRPAGCASSPTRVSPSAVTRVTSSRLAGRTVLAVISVIESLPVSLRAGAWPPGPPLPACVVPVPALFRARRVRGPDDQVRGAGQQFLVAARAAVGLGRGGAGDLPDHPVAVRPFFRLRRAEA